MWNPFSARPRRRSGGNNNGQSSIIEPGVRLGTLEDVAGAAPAVDQRANQLRRMR